MVAEFDWWLLIVGFVAGGGLIWLILARLPRDEADVTADERWAEAGWIAEELATTGRPVDPETAEEVLALHERYLAGPAQVEADQAADEPGEPPPPDGEAGPGGQAGREAGPGEDQRAQA